MPDPTKYQPGYSFYGWQTANPADPLPAQRVDDELADISQSVNETIDALKQIRRSDGALKNGIVGPDQLSPALSLGFTNRGTWTAGEIYGAGDGVFYGGMFYAARVQNTAANVNRPDVSAATWRFLFSIASISIPDGSVVLGKLAPISSGLIVGRASAGDGSLETLTPAQVRSVIGAPAAADTYTRFATHDFAVSPASLLVYDFPDTVQRFRLSLEGVSPASVDAIVSVRCGIAGQAPDQAADDYLSSFIVGTQSGVSSGTGTVSSCVLASVGAVTFAPSYIIAEGHVGSTATSWAMLMSARHTTSTDNAMANRGFARRVVGARRRLVVQSSAASGGTALNLILGRLLLEVKS